MRKGQELVTQQVVVIGAGFGGLAAAVRLAARGFTVTVVDNRDRPGGRAYVYEQDGFTFDGGPTVITAPWLFEEIFAAAGRVLADEVTLVPVDPFYRVFFPDGEHFDYTGDTARMCAEMARIGASGDIPGYRRFLAMSERIFDKGFKELADIPFLHISDMLRIAPDLIRLQSYRTVYGLVSRYIKDDRLRQVLSFHPLLIGGNPFSSTSIYALIHHLERTWGVWFAMGGTGAIVDAMVRIFGELGGTLELNTTAVEIMVAEKRATGVRLADGRCLPADVVVCNGEVSASYRDLLPARARPTYSDRRLGRMRYSMSLVVIYFGADIRYRDRPDLRLAHHNIILGPRYKGLLTDIFSHKVLAEDFSLYLHMPTLTDPSLAPPGGDAFYVLAPVPHLGGHVNWEQEAKPYRDRIMGFLEERFLPGLGAHIVTEHMVDPRHFASELHSYAGSAFAVEPVLTQSAWFRPHNRAPAVPNLYFVGAGTHPGAGVPGVLLSAKIAVALIAADLNSP
jgi:phytoene desaturase